MPEEIVQFHRTFTWGNTQSGHGAFERRIGLLDRDRGPTQPGELCGKRTEDRGRRLQHHHTGVLGERVDQPGTLSSCVHRLGTGDTGRKPFEQDHVMVQRATGNGTWVAE